MPMDKPRTWTLGYDDEYFGRCQLLSGEEITGSVKVIESTPVTRRADELEALLRSIMEIGKRDLSNPKYDSYFTDAQALLTAIAAETRNAGMHPALGIPYKGNE